MGHHVVGGIGLADALGEQLLQEEPGQNVTTRNTSPVMASTSFVFRRMGAQAMVPVAVATPETGNSASGVASLSSFPAEGVPNEGLSGL